MKQFAISILTIQILAGAAPAQSVYGPQLSSANVRETDESDDVARAVLSKIRFHEAGDVFSIDDERSESSPEAPPLETDDAGTPGAGGIEVAFITDCSLGSQHGRTCRSGLDANLGIGDRVELNVSKAATADKLRGMKTQIGMGATEVGVKWRFFEKGRWEVATYPSFVLNDGTRIRDADGSMGESEGRSLYLPVIVSRDIGEKLTVVTNVGYRQNFDHPKESSVFTSVALGRSFGKSSQGMIEVASEKERRASHRTNVRVGWIRVLFPKSRSRYSVSLSTSIGHSIGETDDGTAQTTLLFGITLSRRPH